MIVFRVKSSTDIKKLGGAIFTNIKNCEEIELSCLGAGSLNQAVKLQNHLQLLLVSI